MAINVSSNNTRIAKNTIYLYLRTMVVMLVSLYTSRLVLKALGEADLGIYNLVGSIVTLMAFLHSAQTKATSRFITYELGKSSDVSNPPKAFALCMTIHILISFVILVIAETVGLAIINLWTDIPPERQLAANCVYQLSIMTFVVHFIRVPFDSVIIAHEEMSIYAYMSILEVILQLVLVLVLQNLSGDKLVYYGALLLFVAALLSCFYGGYVRLKHSEYKYKWTWDKKEGFKILSFSGWTMLGSTSNTITQQGVSILFNNFVGLVANTALGFAQQVNTAVGRFVSSFTTAFNPQIIKLYAEGNTSAMFMLMNRASKFSFFLCYIMALPLILNMNFLLNLWLGSVPQYAVVFCQLIVVCTVIDATTGVFNMAITATGNVRNYQIGISISFLLDFMCAGVLLKMHIHPAFVFGSRIITRGLLNMLIGFYYSKKQMTFNLWKYMHEVILPIILTLIFTIPVTLIASKSDTQWEQLVFSTLAAVVSCILCLYFFILSTSERAKLKEITIKKWNERFRSQL